MMAKVPDNITVELKIELDNETRSYLARVRNAYYDLLELSDEALADKMAVLVGVRPPAGQRAMREMTMRYRDHLAGGTRGEYTRAWEHGFAAAAQILADELGLDTTDTNRTWIEGVLR